MRGSDHCPLRSGPRPPERTRRARALEIVEELDANAVVLTPTLARFSCDASSRREMLALDVLEGPPLQSR